MNKPTNPPESLVTEDNPMGWTEQELKVIEEAKSRSRRFVCVGKNHLGGGSWAERDIVEERAKQ